MSILSSEARARVAEHRKKELSVAITPDIYPWYRDMRESSRIHYDESRGSWMVFRYADVQNVMLDPENFSSQRTLKEDGSADEIMGGGMLGTDPPRHRQLRSLMAHGFTQRRVAQLEPRIRAITAALLDQVQQRREADMIDALAFALPVMVIAELLGVPSAERSQFRQWSADFIGHDYAAKLAAGRAMTAYFNALIGERERNPQADFISELLSATLEGTEVTRADIIGTCLLILIAGHETTASLIGNALWCFEEHPEARAEVAARPALMESAIEEVLRCRAVVHWLPRVVKRDMRYLDRDLKEGDLVLPMFAAANLDPAQFPDPDCFDIHRSPNKHLGFGYGIHLCLGATLARLEATIALTQFFARFPRWRRESAAPLQLRGSSFIYSLRQYPVCLQ